MKTTIKSAALAFVLTASAAAAQNIIVVTHGQANDPFWSVVKNGVDKAAASAKAELLPDQSLARWTVLQSCAALDSVASPARWPKGSTR